MKRFFCLIVLLVAMAVAGFAQNAELPRLAVVEFNPNPNNEKVRTDAVTVRNLVESQMVATRKYQIITRDAIDKLLAEQKIQASNISSAENVKKLQLQKISYIVTGSVDAMGNDYAVTVKVLDVSTGQFSHSDNDFMGGGSRDLYNGINSLMTKFLAGMSSEGGRITQTENTPTGGRTTQTENTPTTSPQTRDPRIARFIDPRPTLNAQRFVRVEGGTFLMGSPSGGDDDERPAHTVTVKSFSIGKYEVTQKEWYEVMGTTIRQQRDTADKSWPLSGEGDDYPIYYVNWYEAVEYCNKRSLKEGLTPAYRGSGDNITCDWNANGYRLPTEAEWEFAAKGGTKDYLTTQYSGSNSVDAVAWYDGNSENSTRPVGTKAANGLGIYDMSGNVLEWCWDWKADYYGSLQSDPRGPISGNNRLIRGGSFVSSAASVRSAFRGSSTPWDRYSNIGFRLVQN